MKKLFSFLIIFFFSIITITNVKAEEGKTLVIELPSNDVNELQFMNHLSYREAIMLEWLWDYFDDTHTMSNSSGKEIIRGIQNDNTYRYELLEGVTEEDCIFEITDEMRESYSEYYSNMLDGYSKIQCKVVEYEIDMDGVYIIDYSMESIYDISYLAMIMLFDGEEFGIPTAFSMKITRDDNELATIFQHYVVAEIDFNDLDLTYIEVKIADNISSEDDIIYELTSDDKYNLKNYHSTNVDNYTRVVIKFGNQSYHNSSDYVIDLTSTIDENQLYIMEYVLWRNDDFGYYDNAIYIDNYEGKSLIGVEFEPDGLIHVDGITYENNFIVELSDTMKELFLEDGITINKFIFKFGDPEFIEGNNQEYSVNKDGGMSFRLNIDYDKFMESGQVFIDGELVDRSYYDVSSGSTIITFKKEYISTLGMGNHEIQVKVIDGEVTTNFNLVSNFINPLTGNNLSYILLIFMISIFGFMVLKGKRV